MKTLCLIFLFVLFVQAASAQQKSKPLIDKLQSKNILSSDKPKVQLKDSVSEKDSAIVVGLTNSPFCIRNHKIVPQAWNCDIKRIKTN